MTRPFLVGLLTMQLASSQAAPVDWDNVPSPVSACLRDSKSLSILKVLNPFYLRGDFDGDGKFDYFVNVRNTASGKEGFALCLATRSKAILVGAGTPVAMEGGHLSDNFTDVDFSVWGVGRLPGKRTEIIFLEKPESGDGHFRWNGTRLVWSQGSF